MICQLSPKRNRKLILPQRLPDTAKNARVCCRCRFTTTARFFRLRSCGCFCLFISLVFLFFLSYVRSLPLVYCLSLQLFSWLVRPYSVIYEIILRTISSCCAASWNSVGKLVEKTDAGAAICLVRVRLRCGWKILQLSLIKIDCRHWLIIWSFTTRLYMLLLLLWLSLLCIVSFRCFLSCVHAHKQIQHSITPIADRLADGLANALGWHLRQKLCFFFVCVAVARARARVIFFAPVEFSVIRQSWHFRYIVAAPTSISHSFSVRYFRYVKKSRVSREKSEKNNEKMRASNFFLFNC